MSTDRFTWNTVEEFLEAGSKPKRSNTVGNPLAGTRPDITATDIAGGGIVAGAGLAAYAAGMRSTDLYVFLGCVTAFAITLVLADAFRRGKRNEAALIEMFAVDSADVDDDDEDEDEA